MNDRVYLAFIPDEAAASRIRADASQLAPNVLLDSLPVPVRFVVGGVDLITPDELLEGMEVQTFIVDETGSAKPEARPANDQDKWTRVPIIGLAYSLAHSMGQLRNEGRSSLRIGEGGKMTLALREDQVVEITTAWSASTEVDLTDLVNCVETFVDEVKTWLGVAVPEVMGRPDLETWFALRP
jgi:hypothetical protein